MAFNCKTKSEAVEVAKDINIKGPKWFCPIINRKCNNMCICFRVARSSGCYAYPAYCTHQLLQESMYAHVEIEGGYRQ